MGFKRYSSTLLPGMLLLLSGKFKAVLVLAAPASFMLAGPGGGGRGCRCIQLNPTCAARAFAARHGKASLPKWCGRRLKKQRESVRVLMEIRVHKAQGSSQAAVTRAIADNSSVLRQCFLEGYRVSPVRKGLLTVRVRSGPEGCVNDIAVLNSRLPDLRTKHCLTDSFSNFTLVPNCRGNVAPVTATVDLRFHIRPTR